MKNFYPKKDTELKNIFKKRSFLFTLMFCLIAVSAIGFVSVRKSLQTTPMDQWKDAAKNNTLSNSNNVENVIKPQSNVQKSATSSDNTSKAQSTTSESSEKKPNSNANVVIKYSMPLSGEIIKAFSVNVPIFSKTMNDYRAHTGIDIKATGDNNVKAAADGIIENVYSDELEGNVVEIKHSDNVITVYSGLEDLTFAKKGKEVKKGDIIGKLVKSPNFESADETHLHFEMLKEGNYLNPVEMMK